MLTLQTLKLDRACVHWWQVLKILGVIGSARKLGNCEVLVKESLLKIQSLGGEIRAIRLPDFHLLPCKGCLACVFKGESCRLDDDMHKLWEHLQWADGIILSAPTYFLGPAGIIKMVIDRLFEFSLQLAKIKRRPGAIIGTAGLHDWDPYSLPMLTMLAGILQLGLVDRFIAYRPGPGEVLLDKDTMNRISSIAGKIVNQINHPTKFEVISTHPNSCPRCGTPFVMLLLDGSVECQLCQTRGHLESNEAKTTISWNTESGKNRWSPEAMAEHFSEWVLRTGPVYQKHREKIRQQLQKYRNIPIFTNK